MSTISMTRVIDAAKNFVIRNEKIQEEMIISVFICCPYCDVFPSWVGCYTNACIVVYRTASGDEKACTLYVGTDDDFNSVMIYETEENRAHHINGFEGYTDYVYSTIQQPSIIQYIDKGTKQLVLNATPNKQHFIKKAMRFNKPDRRRKQVYEPYYEYKRIEYYNLSIYYQDSLSGEPKYSSLSFDEMEEIFNLLEL